MDWQHDGRGRPEATLEICGAYQFFSHDDFVALYQTAMDREITPWVASQVNARLEPDGWHSFQKFVEKEIHNHTWFCPITDSMDINEFYKVNHITGIGHRPGFATLEMLATEAGEPIPALAGKIRHVMKMDSQNAKLRRLVLLEDIVGSGSQSMKAVLWAVENLPLPVLFIPLILCPTGAQKLREQEAKLGGKLTVRPVIELRRSDLLGPERKGQPGWPITVEMEDLANRCASRALLKIDAFGFGNTGCSLATFSNTPNNTLPLVHHKPDDGAWEPLFPRIFRD